MICNRFVFTAMVLPAIAFCLTAMTFANPTSQSTTPPAATQEYHVIQKRPVHSQSARPP